MKKTESKVIIGFKQGCAQCLGVRGGDVCRHATKSSRPPTHQGRPRVPTTTRLPASKYSCTALSHSQQHCLHCPLLLFHSVCWKRLTLFIAVTAVYFYITSSDKMKQSKNAMRQLRKTTVLSYSKIFCPHNESPIKNADQWKTTQKLNF